MLSSSCRFYAVFMPFSYALCQTRVRVLSCWMDWRRCMGGSHHTKGWDTHLHKIGVIIVSAGALDAYLIAPCPGGRAMCLYLNRTLEKWNICPIKHQLEPDRCEAKGICVMLTRKDISTDRNFGLHSLSLRVLPQHRVDSVYTDT